MSSLMNPPSLVVFESKLDQAHRQKEERMANGSLEILEL